MQRNSELIDNQLQAASPHSTGPVEQMLQRYHLKCDSLFGLPLNISYDQCQVVTCDAWKMRCGGAPQGQFFFLKLNPRVVKAHPKLGWHLIFGRILDTTPLPIEEEILITILQLHKLQVDPDPITNAELQWAAFLSRILGVFYDDPATNAKSRVSFGSDMDLFLSPHQYEAYVPEDEDLDYLLNSFISNTSHASIGRLRYSESLSFTDLPQVPVKISPLDLIGYRTGIVGMTRQGKSNSLKILADLLIRSGLNLGMLIVDPSGEYTYTNEQDGTSLYLLHRNRCVRYSLQTRLPDAERRLGLAAPRRLGVNFYEQISLGHAIIASLYDIKHDKRPDYVQPFLAWEAVDREDINELIPNYGERIRYRRSLSMYCALLAKAKFPPPRGMTIDLYLNRPLRRELAKAGQLQSGIATDTSQGEIEISERQTLDAAIRIYKQLDWLHQKEGANAKLFPQSRRTGAAYFDLLQLSLLQMLGDRRISGPKKFTPFVDFHDPLGSNIVREIVNLIDGGRAVIIDLSNANQEIAGLFSTLISKAILRNQVDKFSHNRLGDHYVHFFFEEAHRLFPRDDRDLTNVYNVLAKEGAKYHIGMIYATQSIETISPDLIKNTENMFVTHLSDDREIKELSRRYEFRDIAPSIQRTRTRGFARMLTLSHPFVVPVQILKFPPSD